MVIDCFAKVHPRRNTCTISDSFAVCFDNGTARGCYVHDRFLDLVASRDVKFKFELFLTASTFDLFYQ